MTHPADKDALLEFRKEAAQRVLELAYASGLFGEAECDTALENSGLRPEFALRVDEELADWPANHRRPLPEDLRKLDVALAEYVATEPDVLAHAYRARCTKPHTLRWDGNRCTFCHGGPTESGHMAARRFA